MAEKNPPFATYTYADMRGVPVLVVRRYHDADATRPEGFKKRFTQSTKDADGKWIHRNPRKNADGTPRLNPLFGLPAILENPDATILVVEGEKAWHGAQHYLPDDWIATTWAGGSSSVKNTDWTPLKGRKVAVWRDNDLAGEKAAHDVARELQGVPIIALPDGLPDGWDLADPLPDVLTAADVHRLLAHAHDEPEPPPPEPEPHPAPPHLNGHALPKIIHATTIPSMLRGGADGTGAIKAIMANVVTLLRAIPEFFNLRFDEFSHRAYRGDIKLGDDDFLDITNWVQRAGVFAGVREVTQAVTLVAQDVRYHQVRDYLEPLQWDGTARLDKILVDEGGAPDTEIVHAMTAKWFIQAVARVYLPGCQADSMLILEGKQGLKKSGFFEAISSPWYVSGLSDLQSKDALQELRGVWVVEMAELNNLRRAEANHIKAFLTRKIDHYRDSYARITDDHPRQCSFAGTINPSSLGYLEDETGARRFWPIPVTEEINLDIISANRDQYWAEAVHRFKQREAWYLDTSDLEASAAAVQNDRFAEDVWQETIADYLIGKMETTTARVLAEAIKLDSPGKWGRAEQMRVGKALGQLGWSRQKIKVGTRPYWAYRPKSI